MKVLVMGKNGRKVVDLNRRKAIRERCLNCAGWSYKEVTNCEFDDCDLYLFRSGEGKQNAKARSKAIRKYCLWCMAGQPAEVTKCTSKDCSLFSYRQTKTDKSTEIKSLPKNGHIEPFSEDKIQVEYLSM
jgi:hypothetical protein